MVGSVYQQLHDASVSEHEMAHRLMGCSHPTQQIEAASQAGEHGASPDQARA